MFVQWGRVFLGAAFEVGCIAGRDSSWLEKAGFLAADSRGYLPSFIGFDFPFGVGNNLPPPWPDKSRDLRGNYIGALRKAFCTEFISLLKSVAALSYS